MSAYRNFDEELRAKRAEETGEPKLPLVVFTLGGEDFSIAALPGSVFFRIAELNADTVHYNPDTPEGKAAMERDGSAILQTIRGVFADFVGRDQMPRVVEAIARTGMDVSELYTFVQNLIGWVTECFAATPTQEPQGSDSSSPSNGTEEPAVLSGSDLALVQALS